MRPLASASLEFCVRGAGQLTVGLVLCAVAVIVDSRGAAVAQISLAACAFGGGMYLLLYRRRTRQIFRSAKPAPSATNEARGTTAQRVLGRETSATTALMVIVALLVHDFALAGGYLLGNGLALLLMARLFDRWGKTRGALLLREPRFRWKGQGGWWRGGGVIDPLDYYTSPAWDTTPDDGLPRHARRPPRDVA